jgi:hypothetical protein
MKTTPIIITIGVTSIVTATVLRPIADKPGTVPTWDDVFHAGKIIPATVVAAIGFGLLEKVNERLAVGLAWTALATVILFPPKGSISPAGALAKAMGYKV